MRNHRRTMFLFCAVLAISALMALATFRGRGQSSPTPTSQHKFEDEQLPQIDHDGPEPIDAEKRSKRRNKSARYDKKLHVYEPPSPRPGIVHETLIINDWEVGLPAIPVDRSDAVVIGEVTDTQAHLSNDKTGVYSEFVICVSEILKNDQHVPLSSGGLIAAERLGGRVRFSSGRVLPVRVMGQGMPRLGRRYLLFLKRYEQEDGYQILTGYELRSGQVTPLDGVKNSGGSKWKFDVYKGAQEPAFLKEVREAIAILPQ